MSSARSRRGGGERWQVKGSNSYHHERHTKQPVWRPSCSVSSASTATLPSASLSRSSSFQSTRASSIGGEDVIVKHRLHSGSFEALQLQEAEQTAGALNKEGGTISEAVVSNIAKPCTDCRVDTAPRQQGEIQQGSMVQEKIGCLTLAHVEAYAAGGDSRCSSALSYLHKVSAERRATATWAMMHRMATLKGFDQYLDPATGFSVFTTTCLKTRPCCNLGCRHCPHGGTKLKGIPIEDW